MELQGRELRIGNQGEDVRRLQTELLELQRLKPELNLQLPAEECRSRRLGGGTRDAVLVLQEFCDLDETGVVDERTALLLGDTVYQLQVAEAQALGYYHIRGRVVSSASGGGVAAIRLEGRDMVAPERVLASVVTDADGDFAFQICKKDYIEIFGDEVQPDIFFRAYDGDECVASTEGTVGWSSDQPLAEVIIEVGAASSDGDSQVGEPEFSVFGTVVLIDGTPVPDVIVAAFDRDLRSQQALGQRTTDNQGAYTIQYTAAQIVRHERGTADLVVQAISREGSLLASSPILYNAEQHVEINLVISPAVQTAPSLFEQLAATMAPLIGELSIDELEEDGEHADVSFLSGETELDRDVVTRFVLGHKLAARAVQPEFWFALLGGVSFQQMQASSLQGLSIAVCDSLSALDAATVRRCVTSSLSRDEIAASLVDRLDGWIESFLAFAASWEVGETGTPTFAKQALEAAGILDETTQVLFSRILHEHGGAFDASLVQLQESAAFTTSQIGTLTTFYQLAEITRGNPSVAQALRADFQIEKPEDVRALAKQGEAEWEAWVDRKVAAGSISVPLVFTAIGESAELPPPELYGKVLERQFRRTFPTMSFTGRLEHAIGNGGARGVQYAESLVRFLNQSEDFSLTSTNVDTYLETITDSRLSALATDSEFRHELKAVQRLFKLAETFEATDTLRADGVRSAQDIYLMGPSFIDKYATAPGFTFDSAQVTWNRAFNVYSAVLTVVGDLNAQEFDTTPLVLQGSKSDLSGFPNWENLFRTGDLCECEHCRSVLGPAAYFADLLQFLSKRSAVGSEPWAKDVLLNRRPDLGNLELSCENALTPLPYIDVVCEVLENAIAPNGNSVQLTTLSSIPSDAAAAREAIQSSFLGAGIDLGGECTVTRLGTSHRWVAHGKTATYLLEKKSGATSYLGVVQPNTRVSADELRAYPQFVNPAAYKILSEAQHPFGLPFDLYAEEVRASFRKSGLRRWDLMKTLRANPDSGSPSVPTDLDIAAEYFSISFAEKGLILEAARSATKQKTFWGGTTGQWLKELKRVDTFLVRSKLEYNELLMLLDLPFINPDGSLFIHHDDATCDTSAKTIEGLDVPSLDRIHRFLRLWRKLSDWKAWELDLVLRHPKIGGGKLDGDFLTALFHVCELRKHLGAKTEVEELAALFGPLNTRNHFTTLYGERNPSLYETLFLNRRLINPLNPWFEIDPAGGIVPGGKLSDSSVSAVLQAVLRLSEKDLDLLLELVSPGTDLIDDLTLENVSLLWRHAWLAKQMKLKMEHWVVLLELFGPDTPEMDTPAALRSVLEDIQRVLAADLSVDDLNWILRADPKSKAAVPDADAARFLLTLRTAVQQIHGELDPSQYPALAATSPQDAEALSEVLLSLLQRLDRNAESAARFHAILSDDVIQEISVGGLPAGFSLPEAITDAIRITYDPMRSVLRFAGLMTDSERAELLTVGGGGEFDKAIESFYTVPRLHLMHSSLRFEAPLQVLPPVDFSSLASEGLCAKISYDPERRMLGFVGFMTDSELEDLLSLSADSAYTTAVYGLFSQSSSSPAFEQTTWLKDTDLEWPLRDRLDPEKDNLAANLAEAIRQALGYLKQVESENLVVQLSSADLGLTAAMTRNLLSRSGALPPTTPPTTPLEYFAGEFAETQAAMDRDTAEVTQAFEIWCWACRAAQLWTTWKLTLQDVERLTELKEEAACLSVESLPLEATSPQASLGRYLATHRLLHHRRLVPERGISFLQLLCDLANDDDKSVDDFAADVERVNDAWPADEVASLLNTLEPDNLSAFLTPAAWDHLRSAWYYLDCLQCHTPLALTFASPAMTEQHAKNLRELLRSKFGMESWQALSAEIQDALRERKRGALAAYRLTQPKPDDAPKDEWKTTDDLYAYHLLDVDMSSCQLTSRLVQGSGSVQLFVQRCFMGFEPAVVVKDGGTDGDSAWRWWKWMRKYRVWEANRKVFLWPENWIEPELKKDRSPFFRDLENELLQGEINQDTVEVAFINYLGKLDEVAQLEIAGCYHEDDGDNAIFHVFGRTTGAEPHQYFYRTYDYRQWTPWQKVDLDIEGDYLVPAVINRRLYLFWPVFSEIPDERKNTKADVPGAKESEQPDRQLEKAWKCLRLQMAVSEYRHGKWTPERISRDEHLSEPYNVEIERKCYRFRAIDRSRIDGRFGIVYDGCSVGPERVPLAKLDGAFGLIGCAGVPERADFPGFYVVAVRPEVTAVGLSSKWMKWEEVNSWLRDFDDFTLVETHGWLGAWIGHLPILNETPGRFKMTAPWQLSYLDAFGADQKMEGSWGDWRFEMVVPTGSWLPYFYNDNRRTFFVLPVLAFGGCGFDMPAFAFSTEIRFRYPAVKGLFRAAETWIEGKIRLWLENHLALDSIGEDYRDGIERYLHAQFPDTHTPGYSDAELTDLIGRYLMRSVHRFLAQWSWGIHRFSKYRFHNYYHPFVCEFMKLVYNPLRGISALMSRETQLMDTGFDFARVYKPTELVIDHFLDSSRTSAYPKENVDFSADGAYACYNWELFYHAPLLIANALTRNQRFEEAREWYHYIFNPIGVEGPVQGKLKTSRYWITKPFFQTTDEKYRQQRIDSILRMLAGDATAPGYSESARNALAAQVKDWRDNPFEPHRIANYRTVAYQKTVVMKYLDNLIEWGDYLFRQDSMESINEATQLYVLAAEILGPRPRVIPPQAKPPVGSYNELEETFGAFSNALVQIENLVPALPASSDFSVENPPLPTLFFCLPHNENLLEYWDRVADRLYKIRHCMNIEGVTRQLALFEPPIDPAALVKAVAGGMDIGSALADLNAPLPYYRFHVLLQKANEVCNDVKSLGGALLAALEKKDAEALGRLRQAHEIQVLKAVTNVRERQIEEANENLDSLVASKELAKARREFYESREFMNSGETTARDLAVASTVLETSISAIYGLAGGLKAIPQFLLGAAGFGGAPYATAEIGGKTFGEISETAARMLSSISHVLEKNASLASTTASYERRKEDWDFQAKLAAKEITQIEEQIAAAELRVSIAEKELANHEIQIDNAEAMDEFMRSKYTNQELYQWQIGQISSVFFQSYKLAYDLAKRAERCLRFELGIEHTNYIQFGYWDSLRKGLLSGERLQLDLRKLDTAYQERNRRELELTKHVSFALLDPDALIALRETGRCFFTLPEELFDLDYPGHYFRRIKSVGLSLPCIAGPYTTVPCTLRLMKSSVRIKTSSTGAYGRNADEDGTWLDDDRFVESQVPLRAIATSSARDDSGVFELSFRDERYLPFEGAGAISEWCLELFSDSTDDFGRALRQFDYGTISDAVLHVRYTAREDAGPFKASALKHLREYMSERTTLNVRLLDLRREFPSQWHAFLHPAVPEGGTVFELPVTEKLFPWRDQGKVLTVGRLCALARVADDSTCRIEVVASQSLGQQNLASLKEYGGLHVATYEDPGLEIDTDSEADPTIWRIRMETDAGANISPDQVTDLFLILQYTAE